MKNRTIMVLATISLITSISACETIDSIMGESAPIPCPSVSILANTERLTQFRDGAAADLIDIKAEAKIDDFVAKCIHDVEEDSGIGQVLVEISLAITAMRGAANTSGGTEIPYFVTVMDLNKNILNKANFIFPLVFKGNRYRVSAVDKPVILSIPIQPPQLGNEFLIYVGFQLTAAQLEYNMRVRQMGT